ncbi:MAG: cellulase family glycosylhydrolase [Thermoleophilaceae bacterium]
MASLRTFLAVLVACFALALPASALGAAKGIETDISWWVSSSTQTQDANAMSDLGVSWTRITLSWHDMEWSKGQYDSGYLANIDRAVNLARQKGVNIVMTVYQAPDWASGTSDPESPPQTSHNADYADFVRAMAQRYAGRVAAWEIWNEENLGRFWGQAPNAASYVNLLKVAYPAVKAGDPNAKVVFGGMSGNDYDYLDAAYAAAPDLGNYYDVMAVHPYSPIWSPDYVRYDGAGRIAKDSFAGYREVHGVMLAHGADKPIYLTEFGWATTSQAGMGVTPQQQADYTRLAFQCAQQDPYVQVAIVYELRNNYWANDADDWEDQLGLVNTNWSHKPAYDAFKAVDPNQTGCGYHDSNGPLGSGTTPPPPPPAPVTTKPTPSKTTTNAKHRVIVRVKRSRKAKAASAKQRRSLTVLGSVTGARGGRVQLRFERRDRRGHWHRSLRLKVKVGKNGRFQRALKTRSLGRWRVRAVYVDPQPAVSRFAYFRL